jgi:hypothetical protein
MLPGHSRVGLAATTLCQLQSHTVFGCSASKECSYYYEHTCGSNYKRISKQIIAYIPREMREVH